MTDFTVLVSGKAVLTTTDRAEADAKIDEALKARKTDIRLSWPIVRRP